MYPAIAPSLHPGRRRLLSTLAVTALAATLTAVCAPVPVLAQDENSDDQDAGDEDAVAITALRNAGVDLSQPQWLEFAFHFPSLEGAQRAWNRLAGQGFKGKLEPAGGGRDYLLFASKRILVDEPTLLTLRASFRALARDNGGSYEGWGVP